MRLGRHLRQARAYPLLDSLMDSRAQPIRARCAQHERAYCKLNNINIDIDFIDSPCYKMNSSSLVEETLGFERRLARGRLSPGQRYRWRYLTRVLTRKARQQLQRVQSLEPLRRWLPTVAGIVGVAYGVISLRGMNRTNAHAMAATTPGRLRVFPVVALNVGGLALILIGSRIHGHWFIRIVRHSPAQSIMVAGEISCQPLWISAQQEGDTISEALSATSY